MGQKFKTEIEAEQGLSVGGSGGFSFPTSDGFYGQTLITDGLGGVSWANENLVSVYYGSDEDYARPDGADRVFWLGSVTPLNASAGDMWIRLPVPD